MTCDEELTASSMGVTGHRRVLVVEQGDSPSGRYFLLPALKRSGLSVVRCDLTRLPETLDVQTIVMVRYISSRWRARLGHSPASNQQIVLFMDDDVLDPSAWAGMPWRYRWKLWRFGARHTKWLRDIGAELWVSTPHLRDKYADWPARLILPSDLPAEPVTRVFYHGSASHRAEIRWLRPIIEDAVGRDERIRFELIADREAYRQWRGVPGVTLARPMKWSAYRSFSELQGRHIGLAPLLDLPFNRGRSYTKFFDITRSGAVGVYSDHPVFRGVIEHDRDGLIVANRPEEWVDAITRLAGDDVLRARLLEGARERVRVLSERARENNIGLL